MKVYTFGDQSKPVMMLFPGTCCYWKNNFGHVIEGLKEYFYVTIVSYSGFDETEHSTFISELDETKRLNNIFKNILMVIFLLSMVVHLADLLYLYC